MQSAIDQNYMFELFVGELPIACNSEMRETKPNRFFQEWPSRWWQLKHFSCSSRKLEKWSNLTSIFFKWVGSTTNQPCFFGASVNYSSLVKLTLSWWMTFIGYVITLCIDWFVLALYLFWWKAKIKSSGLGFIIRIYSSILLLLMMMLMIGVQKSVLPWRLTDGTQKLLVWERGHFQVPTVSFLGRKISGRPFCRRLQAGLFPCAFLRES